MVIPLSVLFLFVLIKINIYIYIYIYIYLIWSFITYIKGCFFEHKLIKTVNFIILKNYALNSDILQKLYIPSK